MTNTMSRGSITVMNQNVVYAMPPFRALLYADTGTFEQSNDPTFATKNTVTLVGGQAELAGSFIRSTGAGTVNVVVKPF